MASVSCRRHPAGAAAARPPALAAPRRPHGHAEPRQPPRQRVLASISPSLRAAGGRTGVSAGRAAPGAAPDAAGTFARSSVSASRTRRWGWLGWTRNVPLSLLLPLGWARHRGAHPPGLPDLPPPRETGASSKEHRGHGCKNSPTQDPGSTGPASPTRLRQAQQNRPRMAKPNTTAPGAGQPRQARQHRSCSSQTQQRDPTALAPCSPARPGRAAPGARAQPSPAQPPRRWRQPAAPRGQPQRSQCQSSHPHTGPPCRIGPAGSSQPCRTHGRGWGGQTDGQRRPSLRRRGGAGGALAPRPS